MNKKKGNKTINYSNITFKASDNLLSKLPSENTNSCFEIGGFNGPEPTKYGDWQHKGRVTDF